MFCTPSHTLGYYVGAALTFLLCFHLQATGPPSVWTANAAPVSLVKPSALPDSAQMNTNALLVCVCVCVCVGAGVFACVCT